MRFSFLVSLSLFCQPTFSADVHSPQRIPLPALGCTACHGTHGEGYESIPRINDKPTGEFVRKMQEFRAGNRWGTVMNRIARGLTDNDLAELAKYFSPQER